MARLPQGQDDLLHVLPVQLGLRLLDNIVMVGHDEGPAGKHHGLTVAGLGAAQYPQDIAHGEAALDGLLQGSPIGAWWCCLRRVRVGSSERSFMAAYSKGVTRVLGFSRSTSAPCLRRSLTMGNVGKGRNDE